MNKSINNYNEKEIKNKLKNFKEGADYSVSPTEEPEIKTYSFFNDELKSWFRGDRVPIRVTKEAYDGKGYTYRGHFEEGKDYYYSQRTWVGNVPAEEDGWLPIWKSELKHNDGGWVNVSMRFRPNRFKIEGSEEGNVSHRPDWINCPVCDKTFNKNAEVWGVQDNSGFQSTCCRSCAERFKYEKNRSGRIIKSGSDEYFRRDPQQKGRTGRDKEGNFTADNESDNRSDLEKENYELKKQLAEVKNQLKAVLEELKKLRKNSTGQNNAELDQQIDYNEKLIRHGEEVSETEIKEQVQKSQDLLKKNSFSVASTKDSSGSGTLLYVIGGSVLVVGVAAIIGYYLWNSKRENKTS